MRHLFLPVSISMSMRLYNTKSYKLFSPDFLALRASFISMYWPLGQFGPVLLAPRTGGYFFYTNFFLHQNFSFFLHQFFLHQNFSFFTPIFFYTKNFSYFYTNFFLHQNFCFFLHQFFFTPKFLLFFTPKNLLFHTRIFLHQFFFHFLLDPVGYQLR